MRTLSSLVKAALSGATVVTRFIVRATLPSASYYASDAPDDLTWDNGSGPQVYHGFSEALKVALPGFDAQSKVNSASISLSATDPFVLASLFAEDYRAAPTEIALLLHDPATGLPAEELAMFVGSLDVGQISDQPAKTTDPATPQISTLTLTVSPATVDLKRSSGRMANDADQRLFRDDTDDFFKDVATVSISAINWGQAGTASPVNIAFNSTTTPAPYGSWVTPNL